MALQEGKIYPAHIESYASDGTGVARIDGMVVFVHGAVRGEEADVCIEHVGHNAAWAHIATLHTPSPARIEPDCPHYRQCGGCQFRHMTYEEELNAKRQRVEDALRRLGGLDLPVSAIHGAENTQGYRNKVQFPVSGDGIGYYRSRTHQVIDIPHCHLQPQVDSLCRQVVADWMNQYHIPPYQEKTGKGLVRHLYLRTNQAGEVLCCLIINGKKLPHAPELVEALKAAVPTLVGVVLSVNMRKTNVILGTEYHTLWGQDWLEETLAAPCETPTVVALHHPPCGTHILETNQNNLTAPERFLQILARHPVAAVLAGHKHAASVTCQGGIPVCTGAGMAFAIQMPQGGALEFTKDLAAQYCALYDARFYWSVVHPQSGQVIARMTPGQMHSYRAGQ